MTTAITQYCPLGYDSEGQRLARAPDQHGWAMFDASAGVGRYVHIRNPETGRQLILPYDVTFQQAKQAMGDRHGHIIMRPTDHEGLIIEGAEEAVLNIARPPRDQHEQLVELFGTFVSFIESKDVLITKLATSIVENNRAMHADTSDLMRAATGMLDVSSGMQRPDLDIDTLSDKVAEKLEKPDSKPHKRGSWIVELLNGEWGQQAFEFASNWLGITNHNSTNKEQ